MATDLTCCPTLERLNDFYSVADDNAIADYDKILILRSELSHIVAEFRAVIERAEKAEKEIAKVAVLQERCEKYERWILPPVIPLPEKVFGYRVSVEIFDGDSQKKISDFKIGLHYKQEIIPIISTLRGQFNVLIQEIGEELARRE
jgi:hypothetical protein